MARFIKKKDSTNCQSKEWKKESLQILQSIQIYYEKLYANKFKNLNKIKNSWKTAFDQNWYKKKMKQIENSSSNTLNT